MNYCYIIGMTYLAAGVVCLIWFKQHPQNRRIDKLMQQMADVLNPNPTTAMRTAKAIGNALANLYAILTWPIIFFKRQKYIRSEKKQALRAAEDSELENRPLVLHPEVITHVINKAAAEKLGMVDDPRRRAPALPFGHFNGRWIALIDRWRAGDQLICFELATGTTPVPSDFFSSPIEAPWQGIALMRTGEVVDEFIFSGC
jgi:hypothetical protein